VPTLSFFGANEPTATYAALEERYYKRPYRRITLEGVGHWPHLEQRDAFSRLVLDWMATSSVATEEGRPAGLVEVGR
jgi:pimeloyl-ACP methyl ester carboxylesterase